MQRVFIVDDEYLAVQGIQKLVDWDSLNMEVCGVAYDGLSALKSINTLHPDIVITDIRMPEMSGLELIVAAKKLLPDTIYIIISGYNEFEYAREALRLGVTDYVDKPVTVEKIHGVLKRIREVFTARERSALSAMPDKTVLSAALIRLLSASGDMKTQLAALEQKYNLNLLGVRSIVMCAVEPVGAAQEEIEAELARLSDMNAVHHLLLMFSSVTTLIFFSYNRSCAENEFRGRLDMLCRSLIDSDLITCMGVGNCYSSICEISYAFRDARQALSYATFFDEELLHLPELESESVVPVEILEGENNIAFNLRTGHLDEAQRQVEYTVEKLLESNLSLDLFRHECLRLLYLGTGICREFGGEITREGKAFLPHVEIEQYKNAAAVGAFVKKSFALMIEWLGAEKKSGNADISKAKKYIDANFHEPITLEMLAKMCGMHTTYFSLMFKEQAGQTYVKYLNRIRLEHAKLLLATDAKVKDICEQVGFNNLRHFYNKFKDYYGYTPEQFRNRFIKGTTENIDFTDKANTKRL